MGSLSDLGLFRADLHCHTTCSDGTFDPEAIIDLAIQEGLSALAITDHDTIDAYKIAAPYAKEKKLLLGTGVEFSCEHQGESVHILGYDFSLANEPFIEYCQRQQKKRKERNEKILEKLQKYKIVVESHELLNFQESEFSVGRPHIAEIMRRKGYVRSIQEAFQMYLGDGEKCFVPGEPFPVQEAASVIHQAGGKVFIAHPHLHRNTGLVHKILPLGIDGIECYYGRSLLHQEKRWLKLARDKGLLISGGSDFHGEVKPHILLGCSWVDKAIFDAIFQNNLIV